MAIVVTVPATVTVDNITYKVTNIADNAFQNNKKITEVTIRANITIKTTKLTSRKNRKQDL